MAARTRRGTKEQGWHEKTRERIQTSMLINRLTDHALGNLTIPMDASQVTAALGLLKKVLPDTASVEQKSEVRQYVISDTPAPTDEQWQEQYSIQ